MEHIVLIPGILGSKLSLNGKETWVRISYKVADLLNPAAVATGILSECILIKIYSPLEDDLAAVAAAKGANYIGYYYDWRRDIRVTAKSLAATLKQTATGGSDTITLVGHSMGALVARHILESKAFQKEAWFKKIRKFISICGPHFGAPLTVGRVMGVDPMTIIKPTDVKILADDHRYPSGYQLLPAPGYVALWDDMGPTTVPEDIYRTATQKRYDLDTVNTELAEQTWGELSLANRPKNVRYVVFAGSNHRTVEGVTCSDAQPQLPLRTNKAGDGTVPLWSALPPGISPAYQYPADHLGIFKLAAFRRKLYQELDAPKSPKAFISAKGMAATTISVNKLVFAPGEAMSVLVVPDAPTGEMRGSLRTLRITSAGREAENVETATVRTEDIRFSGPTTDFWSLEMVAPVEPGIYRIELEAGSGTSDETAAEFMVSDEVQPSGVAEDDAGASTPNPGRRKARKR